MDKMKEQILQSQADMKSLTHPGAITKAPVKVKPINIMNMEHEITDLRDELVRQMDARDQDAEKIAVQQESIADLRGQIAKLRKINDRIGDEFTTKISKTTKEMNALKTLVKLYI